MKQKTAMRVWYVAAAIVGMLIGHVMADDSVEPSSCTTTNYRGEAQGYVAAGSYYEGASLLFTNCVLYSGGSTSSPVQGLAGVTIQIRVGSAITNTLYSGTVQDAAAGKWFATVTVPSNMSPAFVQVKIIDASTNSYIYPWKMVNTMAPLR